MHAGVRPMAKSWDEISTFVDETTRDARRRQLLTLRRILDAGRNSFHLRRHGVAGSDLDAEAFRAILPISSYSDYSDLIRRVADGDAPPSELSSLPLLCFFLSSGATGSPLKLIPYFSSPHANAISFVANAAGAAFARKLFPAAGKILWFLYAGEALDTKSGFKAMAATAYGIRTQTPSTSPLFASCVTPAAVVLGNDSRQQMYCHLLAGLRRRDDIHAIRAPYAAGLIRALRMLESLWEQISRDIESGTVSADITDVAMRNCMETLLAGPRPALAGAVRAVLRRPSWDGILPELFPQLRYISCVATGSMAQYYAPLKRYAGDGVALLGGDYLSSECAVGINLDRTLPPEETTYVLLPEAAYFEFIPFGAGDGDRTPVDIAGVEAGRTYELVVTTFRGLYRYRLGDVVKVVGFRNQSPELQVVTRAPKHAGEAFTEADISSAVQTINVILAGEDVGEVAEFAGFTDRGTTPAHVHVFLELRRGSPAMPPGVLRRCCDAVDGGLGSLYQRRRAEGELGEVQVSLVKPGCFDGLADAANQYKPPRVLRDERLVGVLRASVVAASTGCNDH